MRSKIINLKRNLFYYFNNVVLKKIIHIDIKSIEESIRDVAENKLSVARFGDGELSIINSKDIRFQKYNDKLSERLKEILKSNTEGIAICVPGALTNVDGLNKYARDFWNEHLKTGRASWYKNMNIKKKYYNAQMTRLYMDFEDKSQSSIWFDSLKKVWNDRDVVIIEGENSKLGVGNDLFSNTHSIRRILAPSRDAFNKYDEILSEAKKIDKEKLILIALGPTATVLAYDLHLNGYQAIDIGHIDIEYEWFLRKSKEKENIKGKYTNEAKEQLIISDNNNEVYNNEVISKII